MKLFNNIIGSFKMCKQFENDIRKLKTALVDAKVEREIYEFMAITGMGNDEICRKLKEFKSSRKHIKSFYLATGRFPKPKEDDFLIKYGFDMWYDIYRAGFLKSSK